MVNQNAKSKDPFYCVRVTANDGEEGERMLREFQDNEKNIANHPDYFSESSPQALMHGTFAISFCSGLVNSMIEFKQIVGRGTRLFDGKEFFHHL